MKKKKLIKPNIDKAIITISLVIIGVIWLSTLKQKEENSIEVVKKAILKNLSYSISIGNALDKYKYFKKTKWREFTDENGKKIVEFRGYYFNNDAVITIQFTLEKVYQVENDEEEINVSVRYQGYSFTSSNGDIQEIPNSGLIDFIYSNKEISIPLIIEMELL